MSNKTTSREVVREGLTEVRAKISEDLSQWGRARRVMTLSHTLDCLDCDATGTITCPKCGGAGTIPFGESQEQLPCANCNGAGKYGCVSCAGAGSLPNPHRKKIVVVLWVGLVAWLLIFIRLYLMGHDVLPEMGKQGGGGIIQGRPGSSPSMPPSRGQLGNQGMVGQSQPGQPGATIGGNQPPTGMQPGASGQQPGYGTPAGQPGGGAPVGAGMGGGASTYQPGPAQGAPASNMGGGVSTYQPPAGQGMPPSGMGGGASTYGTRR